MEPVSVVIPTVNEAENIRRLIPLVESVFKSHLIEGEIVVVDDLSSDGTADEAGRLAASYGNIRVVARGGRDGLGRALMRGVRECSHDAVVFMDADLSHSPEEIPAFLAALGEFDVVVGSRFIPGSSMRRDLVRKAVSSSYNRVSRLLLGVAVSDVTSGFKAFRKGKVLALGLSSPGPELHPEMVVKASLGGLRVGEIPVAYKDRVSGKSKLNYLAIFPAYSRVLLAGFLSRLGKLLT